MPDTPEEEDWCVEGEHRWVIPHGSSLDYCHVKIEHHLPDGRVRVSGKRTEGWTRDHAFIRCKVPLDMLTKIDSRTVAFKDLYDDPHDPRLR
jgi:hypothetical protein